MEGEEAKRKLNEKYLKHYQSHVRDAASHLNGTEHGCGSLRPSYFPPCGYWSPAEKDSFFHALGIHSRLRPDLIAAEISGKTVVDVCVYLDLLARAAADTPMKSKRSSLPCAFDASHEWVKFEEEQAVALASMEPIWEAERRKDTRDELLHAQKLAMRKRKDEDHDGTRDREGEKRRNAIFAEFRARQEVEWEREDYMADLGTVQLRAIDNILREAEESIILATASGNDIVTSNGSCHLPEVVSTQSGDSANDVAHEEPSTQITYSRDARGLNGNEQPIPVTQGSRGHPAEETENARVSPEAAAIQLTDELPNLTPRSRRRHQKRLYMRRKRATQSGKEASTAISRLKPGRKTSKKLLREQKRQMGRSAEMDLSIDAREEVNLDEATFTILTDEDVEEEYVNVFEGKEETEIPLWVEHESKSIPPNSQMEDEENEQQNESTNFHRHIGGRTLPYRVKDEILGFGYDAKALENEELDLFHLSRFAGLMNLYASLQATPNGIGTRLSTALIMLLRAEVVCFVTDLMSRTVALHEQERLSRVHTKVWRVRDEQIKAGTIHQALEIMSAAKDKKAHFASLIDRMAYLRQMMGQSQGSDVEEAAEHCTFLDGDGAAETSYDSAESDRRDDSDNSDENSLMDVNDDEASVDEAEPIVTLHREIYAPFVWHASNDHLNPQSYLQNEGSRPPDQNSDDLLDASDDSELVDELLEEEELDTVDVAAAEQEEAELWAEFGLGEKDRGAPERHRPQELEQTTADPGSVRDSVLQKRSRNVRYRRTKRVKSSVYVEDSD